MVLRFSSLLLLLASSACRREPELVVRQDVTPIAKRVTLPANLRAVRWIAVSRNVSTSSLEAPEKPYDLYVFVALDAAPEKVSGPSTLRLDRRLAERLLPAAVLRSAAQTGAQTELSGQRLEPVPVAREPNVSVLGAVRVREGALLHLGLSGGM